jgi:hypothetical protein
VCILSVCRVNVHTPGFQWVNRSAQQAIAAAQAESRQSPQQLANYHRKKKAAENARRAAEGLPPLPTKKEIEAEKAKKRAEREAKKAEKEKLLAAKKAAK